MPDLANGSSDIYIEGDRHRLIVWLVNGMELTLLINFDGPSGVQPTGAKAERMLKANVVAKRLGREPGREPGGQPEGTPYDTAEDGTLFFWQDVVAARYGGVVRAEPKIILPGRAA